MASQNGAQNNIEFDGDSSQKCEEFIQAVMSHAFEKGLHRDRDDERVADFAATRLKGPALRWYIDLDDSVQGSWKALRKALLERWPSNTNARTDLAAMPQQATGAEAISQAYKVPISTLIDTPLDVFEDQTPPPRMMLGHFKVLIDGIDTPGYLSFCGKFEIVAELKDASIVRVARVKACQFIVFRDESRYTPCWKQEWMNDSTQRLFWCFSGYNDHDAVVFSMRDDGIMDFFSQKTELTATRDPMQIYQVIASDNSIPLYGSPKAEYDKWNNSGLRKITLQFEPL